MALSKEEIRKSPEIVLKLISEMEKRNKLQEDVIDLQERLLKRR